MNYKPYKHLPPFKGMVLQNFPFIEEDFDAITNYQLLCKIVEYLKNVISNETIMEENVTNLYNEFVNLKNYVDNYFDNLDVQEEINNKLDEIVEDGTMTRLIKDYVDPYINAQNTRLNQMQTEISNIANGSPLFVSSSSEMTDTTKAYVNITDGYLYYYDGDSWERGWLYQSTGIADNSITKYKLNDELKDAIYKDFTTQIDTSGYVNDFHNTRGQDGTYQPASNSYVLIVPIEANTKYIVQKNAGGRFALYLSHDYPATGVTVTNYVQYNPATELEITSGTNDAYLGILYFNTNYDTGDYLTMYNSLKVYKGIVQNDLTYADYLQEQMDNFLLSDKYIKLISNKPLGTLEKGYIAISSDDGANALADTTIELFKGYKTTYNKNIPLTMGLMQGSAIFNDETKTAKVLNFITNYGSSVAIHGINSYTSYSDSALFEFLDAQKEYLTNILVAPSSIIYPNHDYTEKTSVIAGSYYGICATGGTNYPITYNGGSKLAGPRSNMYTIYRFSLFNEQTTIQKIKDAIDYASEHNMIFTPFFHDTTLQNDYTRCKALLDYCVDYGVQKGMEFINLGDIPNIK